VAPLSGWCERSRAAFARSAALTNSSLSVRRMSAAPQRKSLPQPVPPDRQRADGASAPFGADPCGPRGGPPGWDPNIIFNGASPGMGKGVQRRGPQQERQRRTSAGGRRTSQAPARACSARCGSRRGVRCLHRKRNAPPASKLTPLTRRAGLSRTMCTSQATRAGR
jgi:hypothetical protein